MFGSCECMGIVWQCLCTNEGWKAIVADEMNRIDFVSENERHVVPIETSEVIYMKRKGTGDVVVTKKSLWLLTN